MVELGAVPLHFLQRKSTSSTAEQETVAIEHMQSFGSNLFHVDATQRLFGGLWLCVLHEAPFQQKQREAAGGAWMHVQAGAGAGG